MTPQHLSIADLKAVIDYVDQLVSPPTSILKTRMDCRNELYKRIFKLHPPTEPKTEEK
jgi:hypothetical protein